MSVIFIITLEGWRYRLSQATQGLEGQGGTWDLTSQLLQRREPSKVGAAAILEEDDMVLRSGWA